MKTSRIFLLAAIVALISFSFTFQPAQTASSAAPLAKLREIKNQAFKRGEKLKYRVQFWLSLGHWSAKVGPRDLCERLRLETRNINPETLR